jgi:hypothetical protein
MLFILLSAFMPVFRLSAQSSNAGFVPGNIWYSIDPFAEGDKIQIYTMLFNPDSREFSGTVIFFDKSLFLGKKDFTLKGKDASEVYINWTATAGDHKIYAKLENTKFLISPGKYEEVFRSGNQTEESERFVAKKVTPEKALAKDSAASTKSAGDDSGISSIKAIEENIVEKTPDIISKPIIAAASGLESVRTSVEGSVDAKKVKTESELAALSAEKKDPKAEKASKILRPFKYIELFFLRLLDLVLRYRLIFYGLLAVLAYYLVHYLWHLVFREKHGAS